MVLSFGTAAKGFSILMSNCLPQLLIINEVSPFKAEIENVNMVYSCNMYPLDGTNVVHYFSKKEELFLFPHELILEQLLILHLNNYDKRKHHRILKIFHCTMKKFDAVG